MKNPGKIFEDDFKKSIPADVWNKKWTDAAIGFNKEESKQRFSPKSPFDFILCRRGQMYAFELKSTQEKSISFDGKDPKIKMSQIDELIKAKAIGGAKTGLVINFRTQEETYVIDPDIFKAFTEETPKISININEVRLIGSLIPQEKKITRYRYDIEKLLEIA